uniref:VanZ family protein n=1 Tax=Paenibacillus senegalensis TaxID=1465766 RepID=UPI000288CFAD
MLDNLNKKVIFKLVVLIIFLVYISILLKITIFSHNYLPVQTGLPPLKLKPTIIELLLNRSFQFNVRNLGGNVLLFLPLGFLLPFFIKLNNMRFRKQLLIFMFLGFSVSLIIELCQRYLVYRIFDIDDIILNTIGAGVGFVSEHF